MLKSVLVLIYFADILYFKLSIAEMIIEPFTKSGVDKKGMSDLTIASHCLF